MDLYIIGAGDVGGYMIYHANQMGKYKVKGFLDDNSNKWGEKPYGYEVVGGTDILENIDRNTAVAIAIANPKAKEIIYNKIKKHTKLSFPNFIHPSVWLGENITLGKGNIIYPGVTINFESVIEDFVIINMNAAIGHNCLLQNFSTVSPGVSCGGFTKLRSKSFLGINSTTLQSTTVGEGALIGAGSVIIRDVPDGATVVGNPGRVLPPKRGV